MPQLNLSALTGKELRRQLDSSRARGDGAIAYQILQEMAARRERGAARRSHAGSRRTEPRLVSFDMDAPEPPESPPGTGIDPNLTPPEAQAIDLEMPPPPQEDPDPDAAAPSWDLRLPKEDARPARVAPRGRGRLAAGLAIGLIAGLGLGWGAAGVVRVAPPQAPLQAEDANLAEPPPAGEVRVADLAPPPTTSEVAQAAPSDLQAAVDGSDVAEPAAAPTTEATPERPDPASEAATGASDCAAEPTAADRTICAEPALRRLQVDLRRAYAEALAAHEDRALLRQRQLAWRDARSPVSDPDRLARLYEQRIRKLDSAAAEARALR